LALPLLRCRGRRTSGDGSSCFRKALEPEELREVQVNGMMVKSDTGVILPASKHDYVQFEVKGSECQPDNVAFR
jgi:hypothetical protein